MPPAGLRVGFPAKLIARTGATAGFEIPPSQMAGPVWNLEFGIATKKAPVPNFGTTSPPDNVSFVDFVGG